MSVAGVIELRRADIGFGRIIIDGRGVTRRSPWRSRGLAWDDVAEYRITARLRGAGPDILYGGDWLGALMTARAVARGLRGEHNVRFDLELRGAGTRIAFGWRFRNAEAAIGHCLARVSPRLLTHARANLATDGAARFGALTLASDQVRSKDNPPLARDSVEAIELFASNPSRLRVMARGRAWPHGSARTGDIPNLLAALDVASDLGYRVRGRELLHHLEPVFGRS